MNNKKETIVAVPLRDEVKQALTDRANANGRALGREAARIIERTLMRNK